MNTLITCREEHKIDTRKNEREIYLGYWCAKNINKDKIADYHWDDRRIYKKDYDKINAIYERKLKEIAIILNEAHGVNNDVEYWRIVIGPWIGYFIAIFYDRWKLLKCAIEKNSIIKIKIRKEKGNLKASNTMADFYDVVEEEDWNERLLSRIVEKIYKGEKEYIEVYEEKIIKPKTMKKLLKDRISKAMIYLSKKDKVFVVTPYLSIIEEVKLHINLRQIPKFIRTTKIKEIELDSGMRKKFIKSSSDKSIFENLLNEFIFDYMPRVYLEGYDELRKEANNWLSNNKVKVVFTSNAYYTDDRFLIYSAELKKNKKASFVIAQHGGNFGTSPFSFQEDHQLKIADKWLTWGWKKNEKTIPVGFIKPSKTIEYDPSGHILIVQNTRPKFFTQYFCFPIAHQWYEYFEQLTDFYKKINNKIKKDVSIRLSPHDYGLKQRELWENVNENIQFDTKKDIKKSLENCRIYVSTYNATTFLESIVWGVPTVIFWDKNLWEITEEFDNDLKKLKNVGIFHENPTSAAAHINKIFDNVDKWWCSKKVQLAVEEFRNKYCRKINNISEVLVDELND